MTTDITELAQREKFEAWWERTQHNGNPPRFGWSRWRDGEGYKVDDDDSELEGMWEAWKAAGAELVEALEKAQQQNISDFEIKARLCKESNSLHDRLREAEQRIADLESRTVTLPDDAEHDIMAPVAAYLSEKFKWDGGAARWDGRKEYDVLADRVKYALRMVIRRAAGIKWEAE